MMRLEDRDVVWWIGALALCLTLGVGCDGEEETPPDERDAAMEMGADQGSDQAEPLDQATSDMGDSGDPGDSGADLSAPPDMPDDASPDLDMGVDAELDAEMGADMTLDAEMGADADMEMAGPCGADERVSRGQCVPCAAGITNAAGDDPTGADTFCDDDCSARFGVSCDLFADGYLKAADSDVEDQFGYAVSLSGEWLAVGAPYEGSCAVGVDPSMTQDEAACQGAGVVYLFERDAVSGAWAQRHYIKASNTGFGDYFGSAVALSGARLVVGAPGEKSCADGVDAPGGEADDFCAGAGAVYVFERDAVSGAWTQEAYIKASNSGDGDVFGTTLSLSGDRIAVGALGERSCADGVNATVGQSDDVCQAAGAVYLFEKASPSSPWAQAAYFKAHNSDADDQYGAAVALSGDRLAVGAATEGSCADGVFTSGAGADNDCYGAGAVYLYTRSAQGVWSAEAYLKASNSDTFDAFGYALSLSGDRLAIGAINEQSCGQGVDPTSAGSDDFCNGAGAVYLFERDTVSSAWAQRHYIKASNGESNDYFGLMVTLSGDRLVVGATGEASCDDGLDPPLGAADNSCAYSGAVYLFGRDATSGAWSQDGYLKASNSETDDYFGFAATLSENTLVVGAANEDSCDAGVQDVTGGADNDCTLSGAVYSYRIAP